MIPKIEDFIKALKEERDWLVTESIQSDLCGFPTPELVSFLLKKRVHLALVPRVHGGSELSYVDEFHLISEAASLSGSLGWIVFQFCGNPGRVLSFFSDEIIKNTLLKNQDNLIICYHTNPRHVRVKRQNDGLMFNGRLPFGTLSSCATHFAVPFISPENGESSCILLDKKDVKILNDWKSDGLVGTATASYEIQDFQADDISMIASIQCNNRSFRLHSIPRSSIKHLAWCMGMWKNMLSIIKDSGRGDLKNFSATPEAHERLEITIFQKLEILDKFTDSAASLVAEIEALGRHLQNWILEVAIRINGSFPAEAVNKNSRISKVVRDILVLSVHEAVREQCGHETWGTNESPRYKALWA